MKQRKAMFELCDVVAALLACDVAEEDMDSLQHCVHRVLSLLETSQFPCMSLSSTSCISYSQIWASLQFLDVSNGALQQRDRGENHPQATSRK